MSLHDCITTCLASNPDTPRPPPTALWSAATGIALAALVRMQPGLIDWMHRNGLDIENGGDCALALFVAYSTRPDGSVLHNDPITVG
jgi:hypothetical protein